jgi:aryl-alcohol dehydrogenase-like predicted oxidoreductase
MRRAYEALDRRGVPLASNQVHYSLLHRAPEVDGVLQACRELNVSLIAYSPLEQGLLTGRYVPGRTPIGPRASQWNFSEQNVRDAQSVVQALRQIGEAHGGKTPAQVALRWTLEQPGVIAIPGAKTGDQALENAGALGWSLRAEDLEVLDDVSTPWKRSLRD